MAKKGQKYRMTTEAERRAMADYYIHGFVNEEGVLTLPSMEETAEKFEISRHTLYKIANKGNWKEEQQKYAYNFQQEISRKKREKLSKQGVEIDDRILNVAKALLNKVMINVKTKEEMSAYQIDNLASASLKIQKMTKLALGESTENLHIETVTDTDEVFREALEFLDKIKGERTKAESTSNLH